MGNGVQIGTVGGFHVGAPVAAWVGVLLHIDPDSVVVGSWEAINHGVDLLNWISSPTVPHKDISPEAKIFEVFQILESIVVDIAATGEGLHNCKLSSIPDKALEGIDVEEVGYINTFKGRGCRK